MTPEFKEKLIDRITDLLGGSDITKLNIKYRLNREHVQNWGLSKFTIELKTIRNELSK
jgi:hypothetical protein